MTSTKPKSLQLEFKCDLSPRSHETISVTPTTSVFWDLCGFFFLSFLGSLLWKARVLWHPANKATTVGHTTIRSAHHCSNHHITNWKEADLRHTYLHATAKKSDGNSYVRIVTSLEKFVSQVRYNLGNFHWQSFFSNTMRRIKTKPGRTSFSNNCLDSWKTRKIK